MSAAAEAPDSDALAVGGKSAEVPCADAADKAASCHQHSDRTQDLDISISIEVQFDMSVMARNVVYTRIKTSPCCLIQQEPQTDTFAYS